MAGDQLLQLAPASFSPASSAVEAFFVLLFCLGIGACVARCALNWRENMCLAQQDEINLNILRRNKGKSK